MQKYNFFERTCIAGGILSAKKKNPMQSIGFYGAGDEARTRYLHLGKVALYRMSYTRKWRPRTDSNRRPPA